MEACAFRDAKKDNVTFKRHPELEVVGVSADDTAKQASFADQYNLPYPIVSDKDGVARKAYAVDKAFFGLSDGRETFFIDRQGVVRGVCRKNLQFRWVRHIYTFGHELTSLAHMLTSSKTC